MVVADELDAAWDKVRVSQAWADEERFGNQDTDGSRSLRHFFMPLRRAGAAARAMLEQAAARRWNVPVAEVAASNRRPSCRDRPKTGVWRTGPGGGGIAGSSQSQIKLKDPSAFRYIGKDTVSLVDNFDITTGRAVYGIDARADGMLYAVIARPPVFGGKVASYDSTEAEKVPGVVKIIEIDAPAIPSEFAPLGGVAVIARNTWAAIRGRERLSITWDDGPNAAYSSEHVSGRTDGSGKKARQGRENRGRRRPGHAAGRSARPGRILRPSPGAIVAGATRSARAHR